MLNSGKDFFPQMLRWNVLLCHTEFRWKRGSPKLVAEASIDGHKSAVSTSLPCTTDDETRNQHATESVLSSKIVGGYQVP